MAASAFERVLRAAALAAAAFFCLAVMAASANAQETEAAHAAMKKSLVYLKATGTGASGAIAGVPMAATGTGFLVSDDGFILTTYHLLSELGDVVPETVKIEASIGRKATVFELTAAPVNSVPELDLLLLKIPPDDAGYTPVRLGSLTDANSASEILTSGFNAPVGHHKDDGTMGSKDTPSGYLWTVNDMPFEKGQSGSPVYTPDGKVIGVAKGQAIDSPSVNYLIPIQLADSLLAHLRIAELQAKIVALETSITDLETKKVDPATKQLESAVQNIDEIGSNFEWSANIASGEIQVIYHKLANSGPAVESLVVSATPILVDVREKSFTGGSTFVDLNNNAESDFLAPMPFDTAKRRGVIPAPSLYRRAKNLFCSNAAAVSSSRLQLTIVPFLKDRVALDQKTVTVEYELKREVDCRGES